jgi:hypothetical protein
MSESNVDFGSPQVVRAHLPPANPSDEKFDDLMIEQYKLFVDKTLTYWIQLQSANELFVKVNTAVLGAFGWLATTDVHVPVFVIALLLMVALMLSLEWFMTIGSFRKLNIARHEIIQEWELTLPAQPHRYEFQKLRKDPKYHALQGLYKILPGVAAVAYIGLALVVASKSFCVSFGFCVSALGSH